MGYDLSKETDRKTLADKIAFDIERYCEEVFDENNFGYYEIFIILL